LSTDLQKFVVVFKLFGNSSPELKFWAFLPGCSVSMQPFRNHSPHGLHRNFTLRLAFVNKPLQSLGQIPKIPNDQLQDAQHIPKPLNKAINATNAKQKYLSEPSINFVNFKTLIRRSAKGVCGDPKNLDIST